MGTLLVLWTIRVSLLLGILSLGLKVWFRAPAETHSKLARWLWFAAAVVYLIHVACAFQFVHHWSHEHALAETARQTVELIGWRFGGGLYLNYLVTLIWPVEAAWQCLWPRSHAALPKAMRWTWLAFWLFMVVNGAVVFPTGPTRWVTGAALAALGLLAIRRIGRY